ncbi:MAG: fumarylacetoacetate hydrolase family protein [Gammaproteobacteria bacterium]|nr:fumarylacetoacetate hydrolase family protein [Gammaproteobacteria bacterium]
MRLATFSHNHKTRIGLIVESGVIDLSIAAPELPREMIALLDLKGDNLAELAHLADAEPHLELHQVKLEPPVLRPGKILGIGLNYHSHAAETNMEIPKKPVVFTKQSTSSNGPFDNVHWSEDSRILDYEGELAVIIGKRCRRVPLDKAAIVIAGYCVANDVSVRDWQLLSSPPQFTMGKSWDTHCPMGPYITTTDEINNPHDLHLTTHVNNEIRQDTNTNDLIFNCYDLISFLSTAFTLEPGDVILTGTPSGIGAAMQPKQWLVAGDKVRVEIDGLGFIENEVVKEPAGVQCF